MDTNNWRPAPGGAGEPTMDTGDWRAQLQPDSRQRIVNKIMDTLKRHLPFSGQEGLQELKKIAVRFEEKIYTSATSQPDYLRKISLKMLTMENKSQNTMANSLPSNSASNSKNPADTGSLAMQSQITNQGPSLPIPMAANPGQARQQLLSQNIPNNIAATGIQGSASLTSALPPVGGLPSTTMQNVVGQNSNLQNIQNISGVSQNSVGNPMGQGVSNNIFANTQRQMPGRQQQVATQQQQQQSQNSQHYLYQQQLQQQMMKQKYQQGNIPNTNIQSHLQPQQPHHQQNLLQSNQLQVSQPSIMQPSAQLSGLQQSQSAQTMLQQNPQSVLRQQQQQQQQTPTIHQQQTPMQPQTMLPPQQQQQQQLMGQQPNSTIMQPNQLIGQQNNIPDMQQQQQRLLGQQNSLSNLQQQQQQQLMNHQNNLPNQLQQLGPQSNIAALQQRHQHQQQQLLVPQSGNSSLQTNQQSIHMLQQSKVPLQQQNQQSAATLLPTQGQQSEPQPPQQQLISQIQSQPGQLQQQAFQQHPNSLQQDMQQRLQASGPLVQSQSLIDQQKQLLQPQRAIPEASSTSLDSTAQTGNANSGDWQEDVYQKIKAMKEAYLPELNEMYQKVAGKLQQHDSFPQQPKSEQLEKLKSFKNMLERIIAFLQVSKSNILPGFKDKFRSYETQIINFLNSNRPRKPGPTLQQGQQLPPPHVQSVQQAQQSQSQISQSQPHEIQMNPQLQSKNFQGSVPMMQQSNVANMQHNSLSSLSGVTNTSQSMINSLQPSTNMDSGQGNALNNLQVAVGSLQQNPVNTPQQVNINSLSSHNGMNVLQPNLTPLQSNSNMLQHQHLKQQEQQMLQTQFKQQFQQRQMQQQLMQKQQLLQQQQQQQQLHQQTKQQQNAQLQAHQMSQLHQMNDVNDLKMRQQMGVKSGVFQQTHSAGQRAAYHHQQLKSGAPFPISSPQLLQAASPQMLQHASPQIDQQKYAYISYKIRNSFAICKLSFRCPISFNSSSSITNARGFTSPDGNHGNASTVVSGKSSVTEQPLERLIKVVKSMSPKSLSASVSDIGSVVSMIDRIAGSAPGNGSRAAVGEDLVAMTKCRLQARTIATQDTNTGTRKMKRYTSAIPLNVESSAGSVNDSFKRLTGSEASDLESTATSSIKRPRSEANHALLEEIRGINQRLIDTVVSISEEDVDPTAAAAITAEGGEGTVVQCSFSAVALSPNLKSHYASAQMSPIQPLRLFVPNSYPNSSPVLLDKFPTEVSKEYEDLSVKAKSRFSISLRSLSQPMSLGEIARTWDVCARAAISEYAQQSGGGSFSSKYGTWENCLSAI
ncbi:hypothetical protein Acr_00g0060500 [Actinidia rufa]|uniref:Mediator complex subunit 15 KIX domain-containing protein n=1 Tax=Actinidia rufa TaxID=165716 RepID=A0A7J0DNG0_9ERIC|nr:hypothetical protein Acr_00g0060500 [Actinidia rufa]